MDHLHLLEELQRAVDQLDHDNDRLAELLMVATLIGEAILSGILLRETELIDDFNDDTTSTAPQKAAFNQSVQDVLESACCLEEAFARKLEAAHALKRLTAASETPMPSSSPDLEE